MVALVLLTMMVAVSAVVVLDRRYSFFLILTMTAALAAFLFIDHRHKFLLPETFYCALGLKSSWDDRGFGHFTICWECPGERPPGVRHPLEPFCTRNWGSEKSPCPEGINPVFYCPDHYSLWSGLAKGFSNTFGRLAKTIAGTPYHR